MILHRELAVGFFEFVCGDVAGDAEDFVIIAFVSHERMPGNEGGAAG